MKNILFLILLTFSAGAFAQLDRSVMPKPGPAPEIRIGQPASFVLANGLRVYVVENHKLPRLAISLSFDNDPVLEGEKAGLSSAFGELLGAGTRNRSKNQLDEESDFIGATLSTSSNGIYAASLRKHSDKLMELVSDVLLNPAFDATELDKIRKQAISGLQVAKDNPQAIASRVADVMRYGADHPYGEFETEKSWSNISTDDCRKYYDTYFRPNTAFLSIIGDITPDEAKAMAEKYFGTWAKQDVPRHQYPEVAPPAARMVALVDRPAAVQSELRVTYPVVYRRGAADEFAAEIANLVLGGGFSGRLFNNLREKHAYTYGAYSSLSRSRVIGSFTVSTSVRNAVTDSAIAEIMYELNRMVKEGITEAELRSAKNLLIGEFSRSLENPQTIAGFAQNIAINKLPEDYYTNYLRRIESVTLEEVKRAATKYIRPDNAYIVVVGKAADFADKLKKIGALKYFDIYGKEYDPKAKALPANVTAEQVIKRYVDALGGAAALAKVKDVTRIYKGSLMGQELSVTIQQKAPNQIVQKLDAGIFVQKTVFNGVEGITTNSMAGKQQLSGDELEKMKEGAHLFPETRYAALGFMAKLVALEDVEGKPAYVMEITSPSGNKSTRYFDQSSGLLIQEVESSTLPNGQSITQTSSFGDYRAVNGIKFPHKLVQQVGPQRIELNADSISWNTKLKKTVFALE